MIESIEGKRGEPGCVRVLAQVGLFGRPTLEHNMRRCTGASIMKMARVVRGKGRNGRRGCAFSVSGRVGSRGSSCPAGITLRELIDEYCGGMLDGHELYGYLPGVHR
jgi:formate dehydrogenase